jgi:hypothetical protein
MAGFIGWTESPRLTSIWVQSTASSEEVARVERSVYYSNCSQARAARAAPIYRASPGYREGMDGDGDGVACEPYR